MSNETNQEASNVAVVRRLLLECFSGGRIEVLDDVIAPGFEFEHPNTPPGIEGLKAIVKKNNETFENWQFTIHDHLADGDKVAIRWSATGRHANSFMNEEPTGADVELKGLSIYQLEDRRITKDWVEPDNLGFLSQLGVIPPVDFVEE